jgi:hypothetical protein
LNALDPLPDLVVITGDLVDHGEAEEYDHFRVMLAPLHMPVLVIPGNHDAREPLRAAFAGNGYLPADGFLQFVVEDWPLRIVALDTLVPGEVGGALCEERLAWLDRALAAAPERPTVLLMHHPPLRPGSIGWTASVCAAAALLSPTSYAATRRSSVSCAATCIARSTAASPGQSRARRRAPRISWFSTSEPGPASASPSSHPATNCIAGTQVAAW